VLCGNVRKQFAKAPDAALVERLARRSAVQPESFQRRRVETGESEVHPGKKNSSRSPQAAQRKSCPQSRG